MRNKVIKEKSRCFNCNQRNQLFKDSKHKKILNQLEFFTSHKTR